jgi:PAS domain S-box-containing protein
MPTPLHVLLLEDLETDAVLILHELRQAGFAPIWRRVETEEDYIAALDPALDLILADYSLPQFDGLRALELLRERGLDIPFIILSGTIGEDVAVTAMRRGASDYLIKDRLTRLSAAVEHALGQRQLRAEKLRAEQLLQSSEQRFRALIEHSSDGIALLRADGTVSYASPSTSRILGYAPEELLGQDILALIHPGDQGDARARLAALLEPPAQNVAAQYRLRHADGGWRWIELLATNLLNEPSVQSIVLNYRDSTIRIETEQALRAAEAKYRTLVEHIPAIVYQAALDETSSTLYVNEQVEKLLGFTQAEWMADPQRWLKQLHPRDLDQVLADVVRSHATAAPMRSEFRMLARDGRTIWFTDEAVVVRDADGRPMFLQGIMVDITARKQAEAQIRQLNAELELRVDERTAELRSALDRIQALYAITNDAVASDNLTAALQRAADRAGATVSADRVQLLIFDWQQHSVQHLIQAGRGKDEIDTTVSFDEHMCGLTGWAVRERQPAISPKNVPDPRESPDVQRRRRETSCGSIVVVPLIYLDEVFGTLTAINRPDQRDFSAEDIDLMLAVAGQISMVYARKRLTERLRQTNATLQAEIAERTALGRQVQEQATHATALAALSQALAESGHEMQPLFDTVVRHVVALLDGICVISLLTPDRQWLDPVAGHGMNTEQTAQIRALLAAEPDRADRGSSSTVIESGRALLWPHVTVAEMRAQIDSRYHPYLEPIDTISLLVVPLRAHDTLIGTLGVARPNPTRVYSEVDQAFLQDLADRAALAIENARLFAAAEQARADAERANRAKSAFLASMSHELRTPLNAILGFTGIMLMKLPGPLTADQEKQLATVQRSGKHLLNLINDLLDLAKIESGKVEIQLEPVVCQQVIQEAVSSLRPLAEEKGLRFIAEAPSAPLVVQSDRRALGQILLNLVGNAIKFTDAGEVAIILRTENRELRTPAEATALEARAAILFEVRDSGIGITAEDQAKLFHEFARVDSAAVRAREGTGLGLRLSQKLAELLGGRIALESEFGKGSTFTLVLHDAE